MRLPVLAAVLLLPVAAHAAWVEVADSGKARFKGTGAAGLKLTGTTNELEIKDDGTTLTVVVPLANLKTGIALRDRHMTEKYLEVKKFPTATLAVPRASLPQQAAPGAHQGAGKGTMTIRGIAKEVAFTYTATCAADGACDVHGEAPIDIRDYGIQIPSYMGITVKPAMVVAVDFRTQDK